MSLTTVDCKKAIINFLRQTTDATPAQLKEVNWKRESKSGNKQDGFKRVFSNKVDPSMRIVIESTEDQITGMFFDTNKDTTLKITQQEFNTVINNLIKLSDKEEIYKRWMKFMNDGQKEGREEFNKLWRKVPTEAQTQLMKLACEGGDEYRKGLKIYMGKESEEFNSSTEHPTGR
jgi:hypothetical protein